MDSKKKIKYLEEENTALKEKVKRLSILMESIKSLNTSLRVDVVLLSIIRSATQVLEADSGTIMLTDDNGEELTVVAATGKITKIEGKIKVKVGDGISGTVAATGKSILVTDIEQDPRFKRKNNDERYKTKSFICVPIKVRNKTIGVLSISDRHTREAFNEDCLKILVALLSQASFIIEYARLYDEIRHHIQDWEPF